MVLLGNCQASPSHIMPHVMAGIHLQSILAEPARTQTHGLGQKLRSAESINDKKWLFGWPVKGQRNSSGNWELGTEHERMQPGE